MLHTKIYTKNTPFIGDFMVSQLKTNWPFSDFQRDVPMAPNLSKFHSLTFTVSYVTGRQGLGIAYLPILIYHCSMLYPPWKALRISILFSHSLKSHSFQDRNHVWSELPQGAVIPRCHSCFKDVSTGTMSVSRNVSGGRRHRSCPLSHRVGGRQDLGTLLSAFFQTLNTTLE